MVKKPFHQGLLIGLLVLLLLGIGGAYHTVAQRIAAPRPPNFIILLGEGQGWNSTSVQMDDTVHASKSSFIQTPNLERLAREGMRFADAYAASPRCTPSRAALLTGKTPALLRMTFIAVKDVDNSRRLIEPSPVLELPESEMTIAELLKDAGYATAHFGKWHVGRANPTRHGFDENDGANGSGGPNTSNPKQVYLTTELGIDFVSRQTKAGKPFLLQISQHGGGSVEDARPETVAAIRQRGVNDLQLADAAIAEDVDINIGLLLKKLDELGIADNTYVIYTTDHGGYGRINAPLNNGKGSLLEGGIRVPLIIRGPSVKAGVCSHTRVAGIDLLPTIAELARLKTSLPKSIEGGSLAPVLRSPGKAAVKRPREELIFHFPHYDYENDGPASVIFLGHLKAYKRYETGELRLYDLAKDLGEQHDLAKQMPAQAAAMERRMNEYLKAVNAQMATVNPNYDASKARK
jgi:arylsulfatase A